MDRDPHAWARLGRKLKQARLAQGLKQSDIADEAGVSLASVQSAEAGTVPKSRMPITLSPIAAALGWRPGSVDVVLQGGEPYLDTSEPAWRDVPVQQQIDEERLAGIMTTAMVRATEHATAAEIRAATRIALDELRRQGYLPETDGVQPQQDSANS
ncbi:helix-turn-helix domain-containing protein [Streptomyces bacillaris]|uniref:helix-turn-helix domain-containing protein n=1 Tax=Streptomyces bacillaris TaxID=68179 RepID=UPI0036FFA6F2